MLWYSFPLLIPLNNKFAFSYLNRNGSHDGLAWIHFFSLHFTNNLTTNKTMASMHLSLNKDKESHLLFVLTTDVHAFLLICILSNMNVFFLVCICFYFIIYTSSKTCTCFKINDESINYNRSDVYFSQSYMCIVVTS